ncbi:MAG: hypothetical protein NTZ19_07235 [Bacteroidetes bacterium]|nr:hypothetical protein [Bacteroidota bacterium]
MKAIFALFLILLCIDQVHGQDITISSLNRPTVKLLSTSDSLKFNKQPSSSLIILSSPLIKKGNNNKGFDIYQSQIDRMNVLIPDQNNNATNYMPNGIGIQNSIKPELKLTNPLDSLYRNK